jgi:hypothetical protein
VPDIIARALAAEAKLAEALATLAQFDRALDAADVLDFVDHEGETRRIVYSSGDNGAGIFAGWEIPEDADWTVIKRDDLEAAETKLAKAVADLTDEDMALAVIGLRRALPGVNWTKGEVSQFWTIVNSVRAITKGAKP